MTILVRYAIIKMICVYVSKFSRAETTESNKIIDVISIKLRFVI